MNTILDTLTQISDKTSRTFIPKWFEIGFKPDLGSIQIISIGRE